METGGQLQKTISAHWAVAHSVLAQCSSSFHSQECYNSDQFLEELEYSLSEVVSQVSSLTDDKYLIISLHFAFISQMT